MDASPDSAPDDVETALAPLLLELDAPVKLALELVDEATALVDESVAPEEDDEVVVVLDEPELLVLVLGVGIGEVVVVVLAGAKVVLAGVAVVVVGVAVVLVGVAVVAVGVAVVGVGVSLEELEELDAELKSQPASALESHTSAVA